MNDTRAVDRKNKSLEEKVGNIGEKRKRKVKRKEGKKKSKKNGKM